jgi:hypothetical protein
MLKAPTVRAWKISIKKIEIKNTFNLFSCLLILRNPFARPHKAKFFCNLTQVLKIKIELLFLAQILI